MTPSLSEIATPPTQAPASPSVSQSNDIESKTTIQRPSTPVQVTQPVETSDITSPQLYTSPSSTSDLQHESHLSEATNKDTVGMMTPPLENGETRLHPLIDEHRIDGLELEKTYSEATSTSMDALSQDIGNQYPSPSGGFVPPVTEDDFALGKVPAVKSRLGNVEGAETGEPSNIVQGVVTVDEAEPLESDSQEAKGSRVRRTSKSNSAQSLSSALSIPRRFSVSSSSSSSADNHSQAISARSSPSIVAPQRRQSSASPLYGSTLASVDNSMQYLIPLKIRDYAFSELDPRHVGARDVSAPSPRATQHGYDTEPATEEEEEEEEEEGGSFQGQGLPTGLYHAAYEFVAESEHELSVQVGQKLRLIGHVDGGWAIVVRVKEGQEDVIPIEGEDTPDIDKGLVPEAYLEYVG